MGNADLVPLMVPLAGLDSVARYRGDVWYVAADICRKLGIGDAYKAVRKLPEPERALVCLKQTSSLVQNGSKRGGARRAWIVTRAGAMKIMLASRKPLGAEMRNALADRWAYGSFAYGQLPPGYPAIRPLDAGVNPRRNERLRRA